MSAMSTPAEAASTSLTTFVVEEQEFCILRSHKGLVHALLSITPPSMSPAPFQLATVITWNQERFTNNNLDQIKLDFAAWDDVWNPNFLNVIILRSSITLTVELRSTASVYIESAATDLPDGPYVVQTSTGDIFAVCRLFEDKYQAFIGGSVGYNITTKSFKWLNTDGRLAVPSRLYYKRTIQKPLDGLRFAVKDLLDVAGLETGCGNRSFRSFYPKKTASAPFIEQLINAGAVLIGKTKTSQFADGQDPSEWFDYLAPFNPRGDGYQKPSASSTGSAVACAGYKWLDFTVGTDTGGSIRHPAGVNGIYGTRSSLNAIVSRGFSVSPLLDSFGVFARFASMLEAASAVMFNPSFKMAVPPKVRIRYKLLYPIRAEASKDKDTFCWFPYPNHPGEAAAAEAQFEGFVRKLEHHLRCRRSVFNLDDLWNETRPAGQSEDLHKTTGQIYQKLAYCKYVQETVDPFIADYQAAHDGGKPFIEPIVQARQEYGRQITTSEYKQAVESLKMFSTWVLDVLFATSDAAEVPLLLFPQSWGRPDYRNTYSAKDSSLFWEKFSPFSISYCSGCPDFTVPVGEVSYHSHVTDHQEWLPISLSVLGKPGADVILLQLLRELEEIGILHGPAVGGRMFT